jgi:hypothetical protein
LVFSLLVEESEQFETSGQRRMSKEFSKEF